MLHANTLTGADAYCFKQFAEALEIIPYTLAENAGLNPIGNLNYIMDISFILSRNSILHRTLNIPHLHLSLPSPEQ